MHRFFVDVEAHRAGSLPLASGTVVELPKDDAVHIARSLRLVPGDIVVLCDGHSFDYEATLVSVSPKSVRARIGASRPSHAEPSVFLTLVQGVPKSSKMDFIVQKATEVGVSRIIPVFTDRTVVVLDRAKAESRRERWQRIAYEAAKQAGRGRVPEVELPVDLATVWARTDLGMVIVPWEEARTVNLRELLVGAAYEGRGGNTHPSVAHFPNAGPQDVPPTGPYRRAVTIVIGPEGGFSAAEVDTAQAAGAHAVTLGPRVLRTETAGIVAAAVTLFAFGEMD